MSLPLAVIRRNVWQIVALYCPGAVVTDRIRIECQNCRRMVVMSARELADKWGQHLRLDVLERRGRCTACGSEDVEARPEYPLAPGAGRI